MGAPKGAAKPDVTGFRKKGTGNPILIAKSEGKNYELYIAEQTTRFIVNGQF